MTARNFHETFIEHEDLQGPTNKNFGFTVGGIFAIIGLIKSFFFSLSWFAILFLLIGIGLIVTTVIKPTCLTPLNNAWMKLAAILFHIVNPIIMLLLFAIAFIPFGFIMKLIGYDPMRRRPDKCAKTYWIKKPKSELPEPMKYQF